MKIKSKPPGTWQSILEGNPPGRLFWQFGPFGPFRPPRPEDFCLVNGRRMLGPPDDANAVTPPTPFNNREEPWLRCEYRDLCFSQERRGDAELYRWETPGEVLTALKRDQHTIEFPVKTAADIAPWRHVQQNTVYRLNPAFSPAGGPASQKWRFKWSPTQELLQFITGVENFYYFLLDEPARMRALMETMHAGNLEALALGFRAFPDATVFQLDENTSSLLVSPKYYRAYTLPHVRAYVDLAHRHGQRCLVHMCGHLRSLLDCVAETGLDGIHAVTPPPIGDTDYLVVRERFGDDFVIVGRLNAQLFIGRKPADILETLRRLIPGQLVSTPFCLWITSDRIRPSKEDVLALVEALERYNG